jgi:hypothetical protein
MFAEQYHKKKNFPPPLPTFLLFSPHHFLASGARSGRREAATPANRPNTSVAIEGGWFEISVCGRGAGRDRHNLGTPRVRRPHQILSTLSPLKSLEKKCRPREPAETLARIAAKRSREELESPCMFGCTARRGLNLRLETPNKTPIISSNLMATRPKSRRLSLSSEFG